MDERLARALRRLGTSQMSGSGIQVWAGPPGARVPFGDLSAIAAGEGAPDDLGSLFCGAELLVAAEADFVASVDDGNHELQVYAGTGPAAVVVDERWPEAGVLVVRAAGHDATFTFTRR